jgi:hypothetical protein
MPTMKKPTKDKAAKLKDLPPRKNPKGGAFDAYLNFKPAVVKPAKP